MTSNKNKSNLPDASTNGIISLYKQAIKNVPLLKYSWIIVATICLLSLAAYFKLENTDVFYYAFIVVIISFFGFLFSYLLNTTDKFVKILLYLLLSAIVATLGVSVLGFGTFIIWEKPKFYARWFPNYKDPTTSEPQNDTTQTEDTSININKPQTIDSTTTKDTLLTKENRTDAFFRTIMLQEKNCKAGTWSYFIDSLLYVGKEYAGKEVQISFSGVFYSKEPHDGDGMNWIIGFYCNGYPIKNSDTKRLFASRTYNLSFITTINANDYIDKVTVGVDGHINVAIKLLSSILIRNGNDTQFGKEDTIFMKENFTVFVKYPIETDE